MRNGQCKAAALILLMLGIGSPVSAREYFVARNDPAAHDENPGTEAKPLRTIQSAVDLAKPGDVIHVKAGFYDERVRIQTQGTRSRRITLAAWRDDRVRMGSRPSDLPGPEAWTQIEGTRSWRITLPEGTPDDIIVLFDDKPQPCQKQDAPPEDDQVLWSTYRESDRTLMVNAGGPNPAERHTLTLARDRQQLIFFLVDSANWTLRGFEFGYARNFIFNFGYNNIIEDCYFHHAYRQAVFGTGYMCTVRRCTFDDSAMHGGPGAASIFEDNIFYRGNRTWDEDILHRVQDYREGSGGCMFKGIGYAVTLRYNFFDECTFWPDGDGKSTRVYGNAFHDNGGYAIYNEYADDDTLIIGNYMENTQAGVASSWCSRLYIFDNFIKGPANGIILHNRDKWPLRHSFMVIRGNAIVGTSMALSGYGPAYATYSEGWSNCLVDYNRYRIRPEHGMLLDFNGELRFQHIEDMRESLGWDLHGEAAPYDPDNNDLTPESLGGGTVTVRTPIGKNGWKSRAYLADPHLNGTFPAAVRMRNSLIPSFFWRVADGNYNSSPLFWHAPHLLHDGTWQPDSSAGYHEGEVRGCSWCISADQPTDGPEQKWHKLLNASDGNKFLLVKGKTPTKMLPQGAGWWTPSLPTAPGAVIDLSLRIRGRDLEPVGESGGVAVWMQFTSLTGQHKSRVFLVGRDDAGTEERGNLMRGTYAWNEIKQAVTAPDTAGRMAFFLGMRPGKGAVHFDDIQIKTRPGPMPETAQKVDALPPRVPLRRFRDVFHVDLSDVVNRSFADDEANNGKGGWSDQGPACDMRAVKTGLRKFGGVPFKILDEPKSIVVLKSRWRNPGNLPEKVTIPVGRKVDTLFFLHSAAWFRKFSYILHYADGNEVTLTVDTNNMDDWAAADPRTYFPAEQDTYSTVAETVPSPMFGQGSLYRMEWSAPEDRRNVELKSIEFVSPGNCVPILVAITGILEW